MPESLLNTITEFAGSYPYVFLAVLFALLVGALNGLWLLVSIGSLKKRVARTEKILGTHSKLFDARSGEFGAIQKMIRAEKAVLDIERDKIKALEAKLNALSSTTKEEDQSADDSAKGVAEPTALPPAETEIVDDSDDQPTQRTEKGFFEL